MPIIESTLLCKKYDNRYVLRNINMSVEPGQVLGYIGPNGSGKSTTIKIICGITETFEGEVKVFGMDVRKHFLEIKQRIGYVPEQAALYDLLTPIEYLRFTGLLYNMPEDKIRNKSLDLLRLFELEKQASDRMNSFSKGMKQKVLLISGLLHNPELIFFDEPLSGLDANAVILVKEILLQLKKAGKTIFYSSHIMDVVEKICDNIIIIKDGEIIAEGSIDSLKEKAQRGSLENIFTALTGDEAGNVNTASDFINVLNG